MSNTMNITVAGRLSVEPRVTQSNTSACFRLSFPRRRKDGESSWINAEVWVPLSRLPYLTERVKKGAVVSLFGTLECEVYQGKERWIVKGNDIDVLQNPPGYVSRYGEHAEEGNEDHAAPAHPEGNGYAAPGALPVLGDPQAYGQPGIPSGYGHAPQPAPGYGPAQPYGPTAAPSFASPQSYGPPGVPSYAPPPGFAPAPPQAPRPAPAAHGADGNLKF